MPTFNSILSSVTSRIPKTPSQACSNIKKKCSTCLKIIVTTGKLIFMGGMASAGFAIAMHCEYTTNSCFVVANATMNTRNKTIIFPANCTSTTISKWNITLSEGNRDLLSDNCLLLSQSYGITCLFLSVFAGAQLCMLKVPLQARKNDPEPLPQANYETPGYFSSAERKMIRRYIYQSKRNTCLKIMNLLAAGTSGFFCSSFEWGCHSVSSSIFFLSPLTTTPSLSRHNTFLITNCTMGHILALISAGFFSIECGLLFLKLILNDAKKNTSQGQQLLKQLEIHNVRIVELTRASLPPSPHPLLQ
ncbi:hypothetical protein CLAVI_000393 [Candidatus Clavichlamydia salmonicola]|uniref:hypothetical protein n=1 Tax=Candidatus Clavichlamydia salmonicola TaxID=469812 RepID=UPI001890FBE8|nr:hypothetical protein [Candidatus Clavichlamydia salmonicola]MBF5050774.1 hypothetical protein [Candidatus Clavichlamydia salmonicola]